MGNKQPTVVYVPQPQQPTQTVIREVVDPVWGDSWVHPYYGGGGYYGGYRGWRGGGGRRHH